MQDLDIRPYRPGDEEGILASFNLVFREACGPTYVDREPSHWRWVYSENPAGHRIHVAVAADGTVAGHYAAIPVRATTGVGTTTFCQIVDSFVHPDFRHGLKRPGLFVHTAKPALQRWSEELGDGLFWGLPVPEAKRISIRFLDYIEWRVVDYLTGDVASASTDAPADIEIRKVTLIGSELEPLHAAVTAEKPCGIVRDARYLNWRYGRCPGGGYDMYAARRDGQVVGLMVLRPRHELLPGSCAIAEWLVREGDEPVASALLAQAVRQARARGRSRLLTLLPPASAEAGFLKQRGFAVTPSSESTYRSIGLRLGQPGLTVDELERSWYYTLGDTDLV